MQHVLTVCLGNICRSPAAAAAIRRAAADGGLEIEVDSAGTSRYHLGESPHPKSSAAGAEVGLTVTGRARQITRQDFDAFDLILAMDRSNLDDLVGMAPSPRHRDKIRLFRAFDPDADTEDVPDPYYGSDDDYRRMIRLILPAAEGVVRYLRDPTALTAD